MDCTFGIDEARKFRGVLFVTRLNIRLKCAGLLNPALYAISPMVTCRMFFAASKAFVLSTRPLHNRSEKRVSCNFKIWMRYRVDIPHPLATASTVRSGFERCICMWSRISSRRRAPNVRGGVGLIDSDMQCPTAPNAERSKSSACWRSTFGPSSNNALSVRSATWQSPWRNEKIAPLFTSSGTYERKM